MDLYRKFIYLIWAFSSFLNAQEKSLSIEKIWSGEFQAERLEAIRSTKDGEFYTVLETDYKESKSKLVQHSFSQQSDSFIIIETDIAKGIPFFTSYSFSQSEKKLLLGSEVEPIYRRSKRAIYHVYDTDSKSIQKISDKKIQEPLLSPDAQKIAYVNNRNLFVFDLKSEKTIQVTFDGDYQTINGITDWVYEEEFGFVRAFSWSPDSKYIVFMKFDESEVPEYSMDYHGNLLYPYQYTFRYPKAGEKNSVVTLHLFDIDEITSRRIDFLDQQPYYIPRINFDKRTNKIFIQTLNRHQNHLKLWSYDVRSKQFSLLLQETDDAYVSVHDHFKVIDDGSFLWTSEKDGYNHLYHYDSQGNLINQVTSGNWDVTDLLGYNSKRKEVYYQSVETNNVGRSVYSINLSGKKKRLLSAEFGFNGAVFNDTGNYFIHSYSDVKTPPKYKLVRTRDLKVIRNLIDNHSLSKKIATYELPQKEFIKVDINGNELNAYLIKPSDFDPSNKYPVLLYQYSGPGSQQVSNRWLNTQDLWHKMLTQKGYIIACLDPRGTGYKGSDFKKVTYLNLVKYETEDQIAFGKYLAELPFINRSRIGIWGWSYGGHVSSQSILLGNDVFSLAIAVAPVTNWRFYDTIYTERFMRTPQENPEGYDNNAPINHASKLKGKYLIIHGTADDNVHLQNTLRMVDALIKANKQFEVLIYPDKNHGIYGGNTRNHLFTKMTNFIEENL